MTDTTKQIPHSECIQGRCANITTGCWGECSIRAAFPLNNVACGDAVSGAPSAAMACSSCYGTGFDVSGKACPAGCRTAAPAPQAATTQPRVSEQADERALFEKSMNDARFFPAELSFARTKSPSGRDEYANSHLQSCWEGWQARALTQQAAPEAPIWGPVHTVADMVRNLLTLDQSDPIYAAFHVDYQGERRCRTRPVSISRERVIEGKWVDTGRTDVPYAVIVWAKQDERAALAQQSAGKGSAS